MTQIIHPRCCYLCLKVDDNGELTGIHQGAKSATNYKASPIIDEFFAAIELTHTFW
jgi:hypothetical protein